jgi:hypothetical protein
LGPEVWGFVELPRFSGHLIIERIVVGAVEAVGNGEGAPFSKTPQLEKGVHDAKDETAVSRGVSAADGRAGEVGEITRGIGAQFRAIGSVDKKLARAG